MTVPEKYVPNTGHPGEVSPRYVEWLEEREARLAAIEEACASDSLARDGMEMIQWALSEKKA